MKKGFVITLAAFVLCSCGNRGKGDAEMNRFVNKLMSQMTIEEKIGQLNLPGGGDITTGQAANTGTAEKIKGGLVGGLFNIKSVDKIREVQRIAVEESRLGIPLIFGMDVIHGYETAFPIPLGLSCSWDMAAVERTARIAAEEASASGISWTFSPMVDISRDPRWGRVSEGNGEDPYLGGQIAKAMIHGYQGDDLSRDNSIMACVKHFALYGAPEGGRDYNTVDMSRVRMYNEYFYPYQAAIEAGVGSVMTSFNEIDGVPALANKWLLTDVLRKEWGFDGFIVTDYTAINEMVDHGIGDLQTVSARALNAGVDMDMVGEGFLSTIQKSLDEGKVKVATIDAACRRILEAKYKLGLFDNPYKYCVEGKAEEVVYSEPHRKAAREIAAECFVLLKNEGNALPLALESKIALVGPLADTRSNMPGTWSVAVDLAKPLTLREALSEATQARITYAQGSNLTEDSELQTRSTMFGRTVKWDRRSEKEMIAEAVAAARGSDVVVAALGESSEMSGESSSRTNIEIPDVQKRLLQALVATGKPVVLVLFTGRPLDLSWEDENVPSILNVWFGGTEAAPAICDVLYGDVNPSGKLTMTFPRNVGQIPIYYNHKNTGRPLGEGQWFQKFRSNYLDVVNEPLYPFGYGLSYTQFDYSDVALSSNTLGMDGSLTASVTVKNTGDRRGKEVVQLYLRDVVGSVTRPVKELKGFQKIELEPGEERQVEFVITPETLKFYNYDLEYVCEPGQFEVMIGTDSRNVRMASFELN